MNAWERCACGVFVEGHHINCVMSAGFRSGPSFADGSGWTPPFTGYDFYEVKEPLFDDFETKYGSHKFINDDPFASWKHEHLKEPLFDDFETKYGSHKFVNDDPDWGMGHRCATCGGWHDTCR